MDGSRFETRIVTGPSPALSARRRGLNRFQIGAFTLLGCGLAVWLHLDAAAAGSSIRWMFACGFTVIIGFRLVTALVSTTAPRCRRPVPQDRLPHYTVIVALKDEAAVADQLVARLAALDYPPERLSGYLVVEACDPETRVALERADRPAWLKVLTAPPGKPTTKPRALNVALSLARSGLLTVYDAEDQPHPGQLREAAARFADADPRLACLQAPLRIRRADRPMRWLERQFALEYAALFEVTLPALARLRMPLPLGGTSNHFRGIMYQTHLK